MNLISRLFSARVPRRSAAAKATAPIPRPGESWIFDHADGSPWPRKPGPAVKVLDVQDGWVRYDMGWRWNDQRVTLKTFRELYRPQPGPTGFTGPQGAMGDRICEWAGVKPCTAPATHDLLPEYGPPCRLCEKHFNALSFLDPRIQDSHGAPVSKGDAEKVVPRANGFGNHVFVDGVCACGQRWSDDPVRCPLTRNRNDQKG
jgi:hypothetical protein